MARLFVFTDKPKMGSDSSDNLSESEFDYGVDGYTFEPTQSDDDTAKSGANERQKTLNKCKTRNKSVFHTRLRHPERINSVPLNSVLQIKQTGVSPIFHL